MIQRLGVRNLRPLHRLVRPFSSSVMLRSDKDNGESPPKTSADKVPMDRRQERNRKKSLNPVRSRREGDFQGQDFNMGKRRKENRTNEGKPPQAWQRDGLERPPRDRKDEKSPSNTDSFNLGKMYRKKPPTDMQRKVGFGESFLKFQKKKFMGFQWSDESENKEEDFKRFTAIQEGNSLEKMFQGRPFDIFTEDDYKNAKETVKTLFDVVAEEELEQSTKVFPVSAFDEQLQWTRQSKMWHFPIDNEQGWEDEKKYSFQDHVFFDEQLKDFPKRGPVRHFMELVTSALAMNHHLTVEEKHETIEWYKNYFMKQERLLTEKFGEEGAVKSDTNTST